MVTKFCANIIENKNWKQFNEFNEFNEWPYLSPDISLMKQHIFHAKTLGSAKRFQKLYERLAHSVRNLNGYKFISLAFVAQYGQTEVIFTLQPRAGETLDLDD